MKAHKKCKNCGQLIVQCSKFCLHKGWKHDKNGFQSHYCVGFSPREDYPAAQLLAEPEE